jgi:hypothetical protein
MSHREEIDGVHNAIDAKHDLPVYHRIHHLLKLVASQLHDLRANNELSLRTIANLALEFDSTFAFVAGLIRVGLTENKEELYAVLSDLRDKVDDCLCRQVICELGSRIAKEDRVCPFVEQLSAAAKLELIRWFVQVKHEESFVFDLLTDKVLNEGSIDRDQCRLVLRQIRQSTDMCLRQRALQYTVTWTEQDGTNNMDDDDNDGDSLSYTDDSNMSSRND